MTPGLEDEMAFKFVHTADWHLGMRFPSFPAEDELTLMRARMEVVDRIFGVAAAHRVDAVLCAGDLFDDPAPEEDWWRGLLQRLARVRTPVFLLPGNHDPFTPSSVWHASHPFRRQLPDHVHVVDRDDFTFAWSDTAVLHAVPCRTFAGQFELAQALPMRAPGDERIRIGMVHGQTFDIEGCQTNFPIARDVAAQRGFDYLAIGDTHGFREVPPGARFPMVYPSAPEPTRFGEDDAGYVALVFMPAGRRRAVIRRERVGRWRWLDQTCTRLAELKTLAQSDDLRSAVVRLTLRMRLPPEEYDEAEQWVRRLGGTDVAHGRAGVLLVDRSHFEVETGDMAKAFDDLPEVLQSAVERLREAEATAGPDRAGRALYHLYRLVTEAR